jgi:hypothetical protein
MTVIMLASVLLDRQALTMRNLAIAAALVILIQPETIMGASFQLSFAAVAALVAVYEARMGAAAQGHEEMYGSAARPVAGSGKRSRSIPSNCIYGGVRSACCSRPSARPRPRLPSWPIISMSSAPMC